MKKIFLIVVGLILITFTAALFYIRQYPNLTIDAIGAMPEMALPAKGERVMIFSPHADDETLGAGGFIQKAIQNGVQIYIIFITNGDGNRFTSMEEFKKLYPRADDFIASGYTRQNEAKKALAILGVKEQNIYFLGYPDLGLEDLANKNWSTPYKSPYTQKSSSPYYNSYHQNAEYAGENLAGDIQTLLETFQPKMVLTTLPSDIHQDHAAAGVFVKRAIANAAPRPELYFYLIHFRHFPVPKGLHKNLYLRPPARLLTDSYRIFKLSLDDSTIALKEKAVLAYKSQLKSPMLKNLMEGFIRQNELFFKD